MQLHNNNGIFACGYRNICQLFITVYNFIYMNAITTHVALLLTYMNFGK